MHLLFVLFEFQRNFKIFFSPFYCLHFLVILRFCRSPNNNLIYEYVCGSKFKEALKIIF